MSGAGFALRTDPFVKVVPRILNFESFFGRRFPHEEAYRYFVFAANALNLYPG